MGSLKMSANEFYDFAAKNRVDETKKLLREFIDAGQPEEFVPGYTSRALCRLAGAALDDIGVNQVKSHMETTHGHYLYFYMWGLTDSIEEISELTNQLKEKREQSK